MSGRRPFIVIVDCVAGNTNEIKIAGSGLMIMTPPPIGSELRFNDAKGQPYRIAEGDEVHPGVNFSRFFITSLQTPVSGVAGVQVRLLVYPEVEEKAAVARHRRALPLQWATGAASIDFTNTAGQYWRGQLSNTDTITAAAFQARPARIEVVRLSLLTAATRASFVVGFVRAYVTNAALDANTSAAVWTGLQAVNAPQVRMAAADNATADYPGNGQPFSIITLDTNLSDGVAEIEFPAPGYDLLPQRELRIYSFATAAVRLVVTAHLKGYCQSPGILLPA